MVNALEQSLLALLLIVLMAGMGATLTLQDFRDILRAPRGVAIGLASQFGWMPLIAFALAKGLSLPPEIAVGLVLVGCTPGGTTSNLFAYFARADVALSVSMTAASTLAAVAMMPLLLFFYATPFTSAELGVPLGKIAVTLALVLVPLAVGMVVRARRGEVAARRLERVGGASGMAVLLLLIVSGVLRNGEIFSTIPAATYAGTIGLGALGIGLGWGGARLLGLGVAQRRAVAFETGIQNSPLAIGIVQVAFEGEQAERIVQVPLLYALFVLIVASLVTLGLRKIEAAPIGAMEA